MVMLIPALLFGSVGGAMVWLARRTFARDRAIASWPRVRGIVTSAGLESSISRGRDKNGRAYENTVWRPVIRYTYTVDGTTLEGTRISRQDVVWTGRESAQESIAPYPVGTEVMVLRAPDDPKDAYLTVVRSTGAVVLSIFGGFLLALAAGACVLAFVV